ncbi:MAG: hypothetical protein GY720_02115 [bacterium]|nr:hypothetical protein [bacterium]
MATGTAVVVDVDVVVTVDGGSVGGALVATTGGIVVVGAATSSPSSHPQDAINAITANNVITKRRLRPFGASPTGGLQSDANTVILSGVALAR